MLFTFSQRSTSLVTTHSCTGSRINASIRFNHSRLPLIIITRSASTTTPDPIPSKLPSTEAEVADLLASSKTPEERRQIFRSLLGAQPSIGLPSIPRSESGVHLTPIGRTKLSTDQTGVRVHHSPFEALKETYKNTLRILQGFPQGSVYRQSVESLTKQKLEMVNKYELSDGRQYSADQVEDSVKALEEGLGVGLVEEAIEQAEDEHSLALSMYDSEAWSDLIEKPRVGQWDSFKIPSSTSYPTKD